MVRRSRARAPWWRRLLGRGVLPVCGDIERLPLRDAAVGMVWSNLALQWVNEPPRAFAEFRRVLAPGGLLMFSTFGPDTLKELRAAYEGTDRYTHVNRFIDMHDLGDMLVHAGFADPVMDMEYMTLTYADVRALMRDLKAIGAHNVTAGRRPGMTARATLAAVERNYEALRREGRLPASFEVVYGHAWCRSHVPPPMARLSFRSRLSRGNHMTPPAARSPSRGFFVTGTDTGVGKTLVCCALLYGFAALGKSVIGMKPVAAGAARGAQGLINADVAQLRAAANVDMPLALVNPYCFEPPIAPHLAAEQAGTAIDLATIVPSV